MNSGCLSSVLLSSGFEFLDQFCKRSEILWIDKFIFVNKVDEMFETCIEMGFKLQTHDVFEMRVINMCVDSKESFKDGFYKRLEIVGEGDT